jgi:flagellar hook-associated protein 1 FlgK
MGSLFSGLHIASNALDAFQHAINVTSTNVTNASTPGYARQQVVLAANSFDAYTSVGGGVGYAGTVDSRDEYAERSVRQSVSQQGEASQRAKDYTRLEPILPVDGTSGISTALDSFFQAFSSLTTAPNDATARQLALDQAQQVVQSFHQASEALDQAKMGTQQDLTDQVNQVNTIAATIVSINKRYEQNADATTDPGLNAQMAQALEQLSQYANLTVLKQDNGTMMVYAGQSLIVAGDEAMPLKFVAGAGQRILEDSQGNDISTTLQSGSLSALLDQAQNVEPLLESNLNQMAQSFATAVNSTLQTGVDQSNNAPAQDLFSFDPVAGAAQTIAVNSLQPSELALADPTAPGGNAVAVKVANLQQEVLVGGATLTQFYGNLATQVGQSLSNANNDQTTAESLTAQAQSLRSDLQGVSLDQEAMNLLEYQRSYDATSQLVKTINQLTEDVIGLLQ